MDFSFDPMDPDPETLYTQPRTKYIVLTSGYIDKIKNRVKAIDEMLLSKGYIQTYVLGLVDDSTLYSKPQNRNEARTLWRQLRTQHQITEGSIILKTGHDDIDLGLLIEHMGNRMIECCNNFSIYSCWEKGVFELACGKTEWLRLDTEDLSESEDDGYVTIMRVSNFDSHPSSVEETSEPI